MKIFTIQGKQFAKTYRGKGKKTAKKLKNTMKKDQGASYTKSEQRPVFFGRSKMYEC